MHEVREFAGHADIRTTEVYFVRKEEDAEVAARRSTFASRDARVSEPVVKVEVRVRPLDAPAPLEGRQGFVLRWMAWKPDPNRGAS